MCRNGSRKDGRIRRKSGFHQRHRVVQSWTLQNAGNYRFCRARCAFPWAMSLDYGPARVLDDRLRLLGRTQPEEAPPGLLVLDPCPEYIGVTLPTAPSRLSITVTVALRRYPGPVLSSMLLDVAWRGYVPQSWPPAAPENMVSLPLPSCRLHLLVVERILDPRTRGG